ncbi:MAG: hypothetical protein JJU36_08375 [Phycisphaeraceae bacterium]|nr:hypothetical protein [Phycisphaeraceae bacterium]
MAWALTFLAIAVALFLIEFFVPSGGVLGFLGSCCLVAFIIMLFIEDTRLGLIGAAVVLIAIPPSVAVAIKYYPETRVARLLKLHNDPMSETAERGDAAVDADRQSKTMIGKQGKTVTPLRPVGVCLIEGKRYDCIAEGGVIRADREVEVVEAEPLQLKVREL